MNPSGNDAKNVDVLVNFTDSTNLLIGSASARVGLLPARSTFYVGGAKTFQSVVTTIAGIEVTAHAQAAAATNTHVPKTQNVRAVADPADPGFVASIAGEVVNDSPNLVLGGGLVYAVALNASGAIDLRFAARLADGRRLLPGV